MRVSELVRVAPQSDTKYKSIDFLDMITYHNNIHQVINDIGHNEVKAFDYDKRLKLLTIYYI